MRALRIKRLLHAYAPAALLVLIIIAVWEGGVRFGEVPAFILPAPSSVWAALLEHRTLLLSVHLPATLQEILLGFLLSAGCGTLLGLGMHLFQPLAKAVYPLLIVSQTIPLIALSPILIMWFGYSLGGKIAVVFLTAFFPVVVGTYDGLYKSGEQYKELLLTLGASRRQLLVKTQIPLALPAYFSGLKLSIVYCVIGATIGEWLGGSRGLGYYSRRMAGNLHSAELFAAVFLLSVLGVLLFLSVCAAEQIIVKKRGLRR
ncbi:MULTISPECIES: ABC transporter permease [unclassified Paenibacillus]|uniref:ABC transporter permease n=1 Tax=unclassified Paenibacillus TaxID=185978 RepID=UPI002404A3A7|nr:MULTISPECIES: ABC transporter permease [unclassified Paenibacillus]MDF9842990.1 putative hydroxymethylpyrimidine transport system permease protein [Paenibacillus sp. PastF-2]MDF9849578.1 putative hydroxymethylpyrimidine transport system permease protein [Paenibacillus sp. PastM-2]MDF9856047.1 putative hydroxymethylpyrimidine transport system permease protein [Paenibacillus sp. PastF-1]MDH6481421.1 putative hydroxymethylpyrimidine transport system permease protein [Paenibacillus sp. PastH-2]